MIDYKNCGLRNTRTVPFSLALTWAGFAVAGWLMSLYLIGKVF